MAKEGRFWSFPGEADGKLLFLRSLVTRMCREYGISRDAAIDIIEGDPDFPPPIGRSVERLPEAAP